MKNSALSHYRPIALSHYRITALPPYRPIAMSPVTAKKDGLFLITSAPLGLMLADEVVQQFADGMLIQAVGEQRSELAETSLLHLLQHVPPKSYPLLTALLTLEAELHTVADGETRVLPLAGYLLYREQLLARQTVLHTLRIPPLQYGGHYRYQRTADGFAVALRVEIHEQLKVGGHVRISASKDNLFPSRLQPLEQRLTWRTLEPDFIANSVNADGTQLTLDECALIESLLLSALAESDSDSTQ